MPNPFDLLKFKETLKKVDPSVMEKYKTMFPSFLLEEWQSRGFARYLNGLLITTNPEDYYDVVEDWLDDSQNCHVILRTAFGSFYYLKGEEYYFKSIVHNLKSTSFGKDFEVIVEFIIATKATQKNSFLKDTYDKAVKRLGPPAYDEVYAFVPAIALGGDYNPDTIQKVKLKEHLAILSQL